MLAFEAAIRKANNAREGVTTLKADLGHQGRNKAASPDRPELEKSDRQISKDCRA
jgi:hypothetical protein